MEETESFDKVMGLMEDKLDARESSIKEIVKILYDESKIYMTARLTGERIEHITKNIIVLTFYQKFYEDLKTETIRTAKPVVMSCLCEKGCDFCSNKPLTTEVMQSETIENQRMLKKKFSKYLDQFIKDMMKLTVSEGGQGRKEGVNIVLNQQHQLEREKMYEQRRPQIE